MKKFILALLILSCVTVPAKACDYGIQAFGACGTQFVAPVYAPVQAFAAPVYQQQFVQQAVAPVYGVQQFAAPVYAQRFVSGYRAPLAFRGGYSYGSAFFRSGFRSQAFVNRSAVSVNIRQGGFFRRGSLNIRVR